ncbi:hypothetical protein HF521_003140 [Silurus meridionalis]|uniref:Uncharacterized protein n=1 Tax=Silurus meridionalis TaxID=175797 RepID=A0A8T0B6M9_SILME|nr:hypothetical protein HF521_003140 [Silurus meridionalis]
MIVCIPQSTSDSSPCCCRWPWVNIDFARIVLLGLLLVLYMFFGAAVFSALERPLELEAYKIWDEKLAEFAQEHSVSPEDLHDLLKDYEEANNAGVWMQGQRMFWDFRGALCFVATVISTIDLSCANELRHSAEGYGVTEGGSPPPPPPPLPCLRCDGGVVASAQFPVQDFEPCALTESFH